MTKQSGAQALERGLAVLEAVAIAPPEGMRLTEIAERCGLEQPTAHRLVAALERAGYLTRVGDTKRLRLGLKLFQLGSISSDAGGLASVTRPALVRLAAASGDCMFLMVRSGFDAVCLDRQDANYTIRSLTGQVGGATPLGLGPGSTTILAHLPEAERTEVLAANGERILALGHDIPTEVDMAAIRARGFCHEVNRSVAGIVGAAVPIMTPKGHPIAALAIGATEARLPESRLVDIVRMMRDEACRIEAMIVSSRDALLS
jgi:DNA-binding IclR family transcriptional regulator